MRYKLRPATTDDLPFLMQLRMDTMDLYLRQAGINLSMSAHESRILKQFEDSWVIVMAGVPVGHVKYVESQDLIELLQIQIAPSMQGKGIGRELLSSYLGKGKEVRLSVLKNNPAYSLYIKLGFELVGEDQFEYHMSHQK